MNQADFSGFGQITADLEILTDAALQLTGPTNIIGHLTVAADAELRISDGQTLITGPTENHGAIRLIGGTVIFQGGYSGNGDLAYLPGTYRNHFDINHDGIVNLLDIVITGRQWLAVKE